MRHLETGGPPCRLFLLVGYRKRCSLDASKLLSHLDDENLFTKLRMFTWNLSEELAGEFQKELADNWLGGVIRRFFFLGSLKILENIHKSI